MMDGEPYSKPDSGAAHPGNIAARLMLLPEQKHLADNDVSIGYLMCHVGKRHQGRRTIGAVHLPTVQGKLKDLFDMLLSRYFDDAPPMFLMIIDAAWWEDATDIDREALIWHELCHIRQQTDEFDSPKFDRDGLPVYGLHEHDVTAFHTEVARYGAWSPDLQQFFKSANK